MATSNARRLMSHLRRWKGKERALEQRDEGTGGADGIVLPLDLVGGGIYDVAYTLPVKFGARNQQFSLQVDTGSSDIWIASTSCSTQSCSQTSGRLYNPSGSNATGVSFHISYLQGSASGPVVWDMVSIGGYEIESQALAAASDVQSEPLAPNFSGILGLALPLNSVIASSIPPVTSNDPDGAAWASNLFSITPVNQAPSARFLSLTLSRPGSDQIPSLLGIGRHPSSIVPDPSQVRYSSLVGDQRGVLFWKVNVRAITVYVDGYPRVVSMGRSVSGGVFPTATLDSGAPLILTTTTIANAIYGAIGINPANDGLFYVPCKKPLNMSITIDNGPAIPLHPLDLTAEPPEDNKSDFCIGLIQANNRALTPPDSAIGDMILGVPFLRNVYTVMAYTPPNSVGSFSSPNGSAGISNTHINPRLGLMSLTNPTRALDEFNTVRVLNRPISSGTSSSNTTSINNTKTVNIGGAKLSMGAVVLLGLMSFIAFCGFLFLMWWLYMRKFRRNQSPMGSEHDASVLDRKTAYSLVRGFGNETPGALSEDALREIRFKNYMRKEKTSADSTVSSDRTRVGSLSLGKLYGKEGEDDGQDEFGFPMKRVSGDEEVVWDPRTGLDWGDDTPVQTGKGPVGEVDVTVDQDRSEAHNSTKEYPAVSHRPQYSDSEIIVRFQHQPQKSVSVPLLSAQHHDQEVGTDEISPVAADRSHDADSAMATVPPPLPSDRYFLQETSDSELGVLTTSMAGVGTASRTSKMGWI